MKVDFTFEKKGKEVIFHNTSRGVPDGSTYLWDFGVIGETSIEKEPPPYNYNQGFYQVSLTITPPLDSGINPDTATDNFGISDSGNPTLSDSIYNLIDSYIPDELIKYITNKSKRVYIEKWQLYLQPLVEPEVPIDKYNDEFAYPALVNQLIVELAAYDWLITGIMNLLRSVSSSVEDSSSSSSGDSSTVVETTNGNVKKITTGPTEVEFFEAKLSGEDVSSITKTVTGALQPGGILDSIKSNICMLAERLEIYLPICDQVKHTVVPRVVNKRNPGLLGGPNPRYPVKK